jgi:hypothetical protein
MMTGRYSAAEMTSNGRTPARQLASIGETKQNKLSCFSFLAPRDPTQAIARTGRQRSASEEIQCLEVQ